MSQREQGGRAELPSQPTHWRRTARLDNRDFQHVLQKGLSIYGNNTNGKYFRRGTAKESFPCSTRCPSSTPTSPSSTTTTQTSSSRTTTTRLPMMATTPHWNQTTQPAHIFSYLMGRWSLLQLHTCKRILCRFVGQKQLCRKALIKAKYK